MHPRYIIIVLAILLATPSYSQDTLAVKKDKNAWKENHSPLKATLFSAVVPGSGQIYNRKYWKAPIAWAGIGISVYYLIDNNRNFNHFKDAYLASLDGNNPYEGQYNSSQLLSITDQYRRWRDLSYIALGIVYVLNVMDAAVDGYFVQFDVSDDLALGLKPYADFTAYPINGLTLSLSL